MKKLMTGLLIILGAYTLSGCSNSAPEYPPLDNPDTVRTVEDIHFNDYPIKELNLTVQIPSFLKEVEKNNVKNNYIELYKWSYDGKGLYSEFTISKDDNYQDKVDDNYLKLWAQALPDEYIKYVTDSGQEYFLETTTVGVSSDKYPFAIERSTVVLYWYEGSLITVFTYYQGPLTIVSDLDITNYIFSNSFGFKLNLEENSYGV